MASRGRVGNKNRIQGQQFEMIAVSQARANGFLAIKMPLGAKRVPSQVGSKLIQVKTYFDYIFIKDGKSIFVDFKSFDNDHIPYSYLTQHQVDVLSDIDKTTVRAGYICYLRPLQEAFFFSGTLLAKLETRTSLKAKDGLLLGRYDNIDFNKLLL